MALRYKLTEKGKKAPFFEPPLKALIRKSLRGYQRLGLTRERLDKEVERRNPTVNPIDKRDITKRLHQMIKEGRVKREFS